MLFSEPKIPQLSLLTNNTTPVCACFSALQRAENSSIAPQAMPASGLNEFQCSSASRKFLNYRTTILPQSVVDGFSALQRAENSSIELCGGFIHQTAPVSVLFSEPKIPQFPPQRAQLDAVLLFQCSSASRKFLNPIKVRGTQRPAGGFSALQRAENSSIENRRNRGFF